MSVFKDSAINPILSDGLDLTEDQKKLLEDAGQYPNSIWPIVSSNMFLAKSLERSLENHSNALNSSAKASEKHAKSLTTATTWLVIATFVLAILSTIQLFKN